MVGRTQRGGEARLARRFDRREAGRVVEHERRSDVARAERRPAERPDRHEQEEELQQEERAKAKPPAQAEALRGLDAVEQKESGHGSSARPLPKQVRYQKERYE